MSNAILQITATITAAGAIVLALWAKSLASRASAASLRASAAESYWMNLAFLWPTERNRMKVTVNREHPEYDVTP